jgi:GTPase SAR1 family protein
MARDDTFPFDVFLSHNSKDKPRVRRLAARLKRAGLRVWFDAWILRLGDDIYLAIERGLEASHTLVLCMSPATFGSDWVSLERSTVLFRDPTNAARRFVPLLLADCEMPDTLRRYKYIDYRRAGASTFKELLVACRQEVEAPSPIKPSKAEKEAEPKQAAKQPEPLAVLERKLTGHEGWVPSVAISPDGTWTASASHDKTVKIWDLQTGECRATLEGHTDEVRCIAITPDGKRLLSGAGDGMIRVWSVQTARQDNTLRGRQGEVRSLSVLPGGKQLLSCGAASKEQIELWDINSGSRLWGTKGHETVVTSIVATRDAKRAISASFDHTLKVWNLETGECLATLRGHTDVVQSVQITPDERYAVSGSNDKPVKIWDLEMGTCITTLEGHQSDIDSIAISPDGTLVASTGFIDHTIRLWDWMAGICLQVIEDKESYFTPMSVAFSPDGARLVVGAGVLGVGDYGLYIFRLTGVKATQPVEATRRYVNAKVVLLGESGVGKSGLAHRLIEDTFVPTHSTHGMQVWRLDLPLEQQDTLEREALLWDLAGQEDYRIIHQLFLDETAMALMLINPQKDDPFVEVGDWLKALRAAVAAKDSHREVVKLLIGARVDVGAIKISQRKIDQFLRERGFAGYLPTSALRGDNCFDQQSNGQPSALKRLIAQHIPWDTLQRTSTPRLLADIKNTVLDMTERKDIRLLRFSELCQRLEQTLTGYTIGEADVRTAITLLANHGLVVPLKFGDLVLLRPELLNGYAGAVIHSARAHLDEIGCVREDAI